MLGIITLTFSTLNNHWRRTQTQSETYLVSIFYMFITTQPNHGAGPIRAISANIVTLFTGLSPY